MPAYYNEHDKFAAGWLRELIKANLIAPGEVDERSITDVQPEELAGFTQCHFFAGIGVWSYALRAAGWADDTPVWTGSCPCQSFSASGKRGGFSDERHLWPAWFRLICECKPDTVFGEQVASKDGLAWFDIVSSDMEGEGYAIGAADTCAAGFGAPHIRQRIYFGANYNSERRDREQVRLQLGQSQLSSIEAAGSGGLGFGSHPELNGGRSDISRREAQGRSIDGRDSETGERADSAVSGRESIAPGLRGFDTGVQPGGARLESGDLHDGSGAHLNSECAGLERHIGDERIGRGSGWLDQDSARSVAASGATRGFWAGCDWWYGRDGKYRPIESGLFPLAHGAPNRVGRLRGYGNALNAEQAKGFIEAYMETDEPVAAPKQVSLISE